MKWIEITVFTTDQGLDAVCARLDMLGIAQTVVEQSRESIEAFLKDTAKYWDYADLDELVSGNCPCVKAYVADVAENKGIVEAVAQSFAKLKQEDVGIDLGSLLVVTRMTDDEDWANNWKLYYKPLKIGDKLLIRPSWEEAEPDGRIVLSLDPGMAFGTGSHHTTRMCLELLERAVRPGIKAMDLGCGSGILSIAALLLGAREAVGVDIDPIAEKIVCENAAMNGIGTDRYRVLIGNLLEDAQLVEEICKSRYEVVTANIVASVIVELCKTVQRLIAPGGRFIASGIIRNRLDDVLTALGAHGFTVFEVRYAEDWCAVLAEPRGTCL